jgi:hypothetical protein
MQDEQERTFEGMIQVFCESNQIPYLGVQDEYLFKARIVSGVMIPFCYAARGFEESGYTLLINLAFNMANLNRHGRKIYQESVGLLIGEKFINDELDSIFVDHLAGRATQRYSTILANLLDACSTQMYNKRFDLDRYGYVITGNIQLQFNRATAAFCHVGNSPTRGSK